MNTSRAINPMVSGQFGFTVSSCEVCYKAGHGKDSHEFYYYSPSVFMAIPILTRRLLTSGSHRPLALHV